MGSILRKLEEVRAARREGRSGPRRLSRGGKVGVSEFTEQGVERPTVLGMQWLTFAAEALRLQGLCWSWRVDADGFERDGCVGLSLQRVVHVEQQAPAIVAGFAMVTPGAQRIPVGGGVWERIRVPTGLINNHDTRALVRLVLSPREADVVLADNRYLRAINGL